MALRKVIAILTWERYGFACRQCDKWSLLSCLRRPRGSCLTCSVASLHQLIEFEHVAPLNLHLTQSILRNLDIVPSKEHVQIASTGLEQPATKSLRDEIASQDCNSFLTFLSVFLRPVTRQFFEKTGG